SYAYRYALQTAAVKRLMQQPTTRAVWGYGLESFYDVHLEGPLLGEPHDFLSCDHAWVEILVETGFVGLGIMIVLLLTPALSVLKVLLRKGEEHRQLALMLFVNLVVFYFQMLSVGMYSWGQNGYMLWITIAITYSYLRMSSAGTITGVERVQQPEQADRNLIYGKQSWWDALETA
ncbi:MAG: O-antigen ligase protein, partial [Bryobacterales bacterium]|nr:O-antigen ligase protein [Bryobacterales bacterium]